MFVRKKYFASIEFRKDYKRFSGILRRLVACNICECCWVVIHDIPWKDISLFPVPELWSSLQIKANGSFDGPDFVFLRGYRKFNYAYQMFIYNCNLKLIVWMVWVKVCMISNGIFVLYYYTVTVPILKRIALPYL